ncbi:Lon protease [Pseudolycoriella hygida]|uniref:Lon protease n=1 Tax=Pseudolycoriella hygida TaxID=35572 RepID=A0A9Q0MQK6_9DIPT|nr:Lon protease [Pseudolycoriella hygida]
MVYKTEIKIDKDTCKKVIKFSPNSRLKDWYPLLPEDVVEASTDISYESQLKRKIAAALEPKLAYKLLTQAKFTTTVQEKRSSDNYLDDQFDDQYLDIMSNQQADTMQNIQDHLFTVKLTQDIQLPHSQKQILKKAIAAIYGHVDITYQQIQGNLYSLYCKSQSYFQLEKYQEALKGCDEAVKLEKYYHKSTILKGHILLTLEEAKCYEKILELEPDNACALSHLRRAYKNLGRYQEAAIFLELKHAILYAQCRMSLPENIRFIEDLINHLPLSVEAKNIATKECNIIKSLSDDNSEKAKHRKYLHNLLKLPWGKYDSVNIDLKKANEILDQEHYGLEEVKNRILESLAFLTRSDFAKTPIICLVGPPGVGKTSIVRSIANALGRKFTSLSLAGSNDTSLIRGFMHTYADFRPGKILSLITEAGTSNPVMLLDEIDKINNTPKGESLESALLQLLDPEHNNRFTDDYFDFPFDLSKVFFIATANSLDKISFPLVNRMEIIELSGYTDSEKIQITNQYLIPKIQREANLTASELIFDDNVIKYLIKHYTKESGVRDIERLIRILVQKYLLDTIKGDTKVINSQLIEQYLGVSKYPILQVKQTAKVGTVMGLAYTASGGSTITIEVEKFSGDGKVKATGKLGEVLKESIEAAIAYIKANVQELAINPQIFKEYDLHIHIPEGAVAKDGPSAGITIYVALVSLLSNRKVRQDMAMTGELTLKGNILPVGGLKEKLSAAVRENITTVIIPEANKRDLAKVPDDIKEVLTIKTISHLQELLDMVFITAV